MPTQGSRRHADLVVPRKSTSPCLMKEGKEEEQEITEKKYILRTMFTPFIIKYIRRASVVETSNNSLCISLEKIYFGKNYETKYKEKKSV